MAAMRLGRACVRQGNVISFGQRIEKLKRGRCECCCCMVSGACVGVDSLAVCGHEPGDVCRVCAGQARGAEGGVAHARIVFFVMVVLNVAGVGYVVSRMVGGG